MQDDDDDAKHDTKIIGDVQKLTQIGSAEKVFLNQPYEPLLQMRITPPLGGVYIVDTLPELDNDLILAIAQREAAKRNLPALEWVGSQMQTYDSGNPEPSSHVEALLQHQTMAAEYWYRVKEWYEDTLRSVITTYDKLRLSKRTFYLYFEVVNAGKAPAQRVSIELTFPPGLSVTDPHLDFVRQIPEVPHRPAGVSDDHPGPIEVVTESVINLPEWSLNLGKPPKGPQSNFSSDSIHCYAKEVRDHYVAQAFLPRLEHGQGKPLRPIQVFWALDVRPQPFVVGFKMHAENQPEDQRTDIKIDVREELQPAL